MSEKTHDPTPKRLSEARRKGDVPRAPLLAAALGLLVAFGLLIGAAKVVALEVASKLRELSPVWRIDGFSLAGTLLGATVPICLVLAAIAALAAVVSGGLTWSPERVAPDPSRLDAFGGLRNLISKDKAWSAARGLMVFALLSWVLGRMLVKATLNAGVASSGGQALSQLGDLARSMLVAGGAVAAGFAGLDWLLGRQIWLGRLRMSRDEVMREHKEGEGDPEIKRRREELHHELLANEAVSRVRDATVLVVNPTHVACALEYDRGADEEIAPKLVAKGEGALAARMREAARIYGVPIVRDVPVARALYELQTDTEIPEALYEAVAEVLHAAWDTSERP